MPLLGAAVDLAAGTGLFTRALLGRVPEITAVEPDGRMRAVLAERTEGVRVLDGRDEVIPLPDASVDGVFVSTAWHWFDAALAIPEIARVLRDGGGSGSSGQAGTEPTTGWPNWTCSGCLLCPGRPASGRLASRAPRIRCGKSWAVITR